MSLNATQLHGAQVPEPDSQEAIVLDGDEATKYRVAGHGPPLLILGEAGAPLQRVLIRTLARSARVIVPDVAERSFSERAFSAWLRGFLDGLGVGEVAVVASAQYALPMLNFTLLDCARVSRLVLLSQDAVDPAAPACAIREQLTCAARPLLLVRSDADGDAVLMLDVVQFLNGAAP